MNIETEIQSIFRELFEEEGLVIRREMTAQDVKGWDSLANIQMIVALEKRFGIRFSTAEIVQFQTVGDLMDLIQKRLKNA